jgi:hypothetical protein
MAVTANISTNSRLTFGLADSPDLGSISQSVEVKTSRTVTNGTGAGQANAAWSARVTLPAGQVYSLDLTDLSLSAFNLAGKLSLSVLKDVIVVNNATAAGRHLLYGVISPADTTGYAARLNRGADYRWSDYQDGIAVTAGNKMVYIANPSAGSITFDIALAGVGTFVDT